MKLIEHGQIQARGFIIHSLGQSLDYAEDAASRGLPLNDWNALEVASDSWARPAESMMTTLFRFFNRLKRKKYRVDFDLDFLVINLKVRQILAFTHAHQWARRIFKKEFAKAKGHLTEAEKIGECISRILFSFKQCTTISGLGLTSNMTNETIANDEYISILFHDGLLIDIPSFMHYDLSLKRRESGMSVGLYIVKQIMV